jgi:hypothetical protein
MSAHALKQSAFVDGSSFRSVHQKFQIIDVSFVRNFFKKRIFALPANQRRKIVPSQTVNLLNKVWREKLIAPSVQNLPGDFLVKLFQPVSMQVGFQPYSGNCARCGSLEHEMHMLFV